MRGRPVLRAFLAACAVVALPGSATGAPGGKSKPDRSPPSVSIAAPAPGAAVEGLVSVSGSAADNAGVAKVEVRVDAGAYRLATGTRSWAIGVDTAGLAAGHHTLEAKATDTSGRTASTTVIVEVAPPPADTAPPSLTVEAPSDGATVSGHAAVTGTASDDRELGLVEVAVDGGPYRTASGTESWSHPLDTAALADGPHRLTVRALDAAGNWTAEDVEVTVVNAAPDTTAPTLAITSPAAGSLLRGVASVQGNASDDSGVVLVEVSVDGGAWQAASGTATWATSLDTAAWADGGHTITARATDGAGNASTASVAVSSSNSGARQWTSPEGTVIEVAADVTGWTPEQVWAKLVENGLDAQIGPTLSVKVQTTYASGVAAAASETGGRYDSFSAIMYLKASSGSVFHAQPDRIIGHELGHVWSLYHLYMSRQGDWSSFLEARGVAGDARLESSYSWSKAEIIADDYRLLMGSAAAIEQGPRHLNPDIADPRDVPGLRAFLLENWSQP